MADVATALAKATEALHDAARAHKRAEFSHRRAAREAMQQFDVFRRACEELGIEVHVDTDPGGQSHAARRRS